MAFLLVIHIIINVLGLLGLLAGSVKVIFQPVRPHVHSLRDLQEIASAPTKNSWLANIISVFRSFIDWGLLLYTMGVILGAFWAYQSYGFFWVWDSKEILSLVTIILYFLALTQEKKGNMLKLKLFALMGAFAAILTLIIPTISLSYHDFLF